MFTVPAEHEWLCKGSAALATGTAKKNHPWLLQMLWKCKDSHMHGFNLQTPFTAPFANVQDKYRALETNQSTLPEISPHVLDLFSICRHPTFVGLREQGDFRA